MTISVLTVIMSLLKFYVGTIGLLVVLMGMSVPTKTMFFVDMWPTAMPSILYLSGTFLILFLIHMMFIEGNERREAWLYRFLTKERSTYKRIRNED